MIRKSTFTVTSSADGEFGMHTLEAITLTADGVEQRQAYQIDEMSYSEADREALSRHLVTALQPGFAAAIRAVVR